MHFSCLVKIEFTKLIIKINASKSYHTLKVYCYHKKWFMVKYVHLFSTWFTGNYSLSTLGKSSECILCTDFISVDSFVQSSFLFIIVNNFCINNWNCINVGIDNKIRINSSQWPLKCYKFLFLKRRKCYYNFDEDCAIWLANLWYCWCGTARVQQLFIIHAIILLGIKRQ